MIGSHHPKRSFILCSRLLTLASYKSLYFDLISHMCSSSRNIVSYHSSLETMLNEIQDDEDNNDAIFRLEGPVSLRLVYMLN